LSLYDTKEEFNVDSKAECVQLNLAHVARKNILKNKKLLSSVQVKICEGSPSGRLIANKKAEITK